MSISCQGLPYQEAIELVNIVPIVDFIAGLCSNTFNTIIKVPEHCLKRLIQFSGPSRYALRCTGASSHLNAIQIVLGIVLLLDPVLITYIRTFLVFLLSYLFVFLYLLYLVLYTHFVNSIICKYAFQPSGCKVLVI